jgi:asparagine N-glycosylation enzyme membrane subunit Stt3
MNGTAPAAKTKWALLCLLALAVGQGLKVWTGHPALLEGRLFDPDCYLHLERALQMIEGGLWRLPVDVRIDAPYGGVLHWTSLFDLILVAGAKGLMLFGLAARDALLWWGSAVSPLLLLAALPVLLWGLRPLVDGRLALLAVLLLLPQGQAAAAFQVGRPDHQSLLMASFLIQLGCVTAMVDGRAGLRTALVAGISQGLALWCSVEGLLFTLVTALPLTLAWVADGRPTLTLLRAYAAAALAVLTAALWFERPEGALLVAQARPSLVHALALAGGLAALLLAWPLEARLISPRARLAALAALALAALAPVSIMFPDFLRGPWGRLDPVLAEWHGEVQELQPLLPTSRVSLLLFLSQCAIPLAAATFLALHLRRCPGRERRLLTPLALMAALFFVLALIQARWAAYVQLALLVPAAMGLQALWRCRPMVRTPTAAAILSLHLIASHTASAATTASGGNACNWPDAIRLLAAEAGNGRIVLTDLYAGPEILWRTSYRVVAGPYELPEAMRDTRTFMRGDAGDARAVLERRGIDQVLLCRSNADITGALAAALRGREAVTPVGFAPLPAPEGFARYGLQPGHSLGQKP